MDNLPGMSLARFHIDENLLGDFRFGKYRFTLELQEPARLPEYKGATLRAGFGNLFKQTCCGVNQQDRQTECKACPFKEACAYAYLFNTQLPRRSQYLKSIREIPRPYVIEPPLDFRREIPAGEEFEFNLILIGRAVEFFPYFFVLFNSMGESKERNIGLGTRRSKYRIIRVTSVDVYNEDWNILYTPRKELRVEFVRSDQISLANILRANFNNSNGGELHVKLLTPMDIRAESEVDGERKSRLVERLEFRYLLRSLLYFTSTLSYFHCQGEPLVDQEVKYLLDSAQKVRIAQDNTQVRTFPRKNQKIIGFMGDITYQGNFDPFLSFLYLGEWIHTGKGRVIGLGQYRLMSENDGNGLGC